MPVTRRESARSHSYTDPTGAFLIAAIEGQGAGITHFLGWMILNQDVCPNARKVFGKKER
jgi:hypothetical protein